MYHSLLTENFVEFYTIKKILKVQGNTFFLLHIIIANNEPKKKKNDEHCGNTLRAKKKKSPTGAFKRKMAYYVEFISSYVNKP